MSWVFFVVYRKNPNKEPKTEATYFQLVLQKSNNLFLQTLVCSRNYNPRWDQYVWSPTYNKATTLTPTRNQKLCNLKQKRYLHHANWRNYSQTCHQAIDPIQNLTPTPIKLTTNDRSVKNILNVDKGSR